MKKGDDFPLSLHVLVEKEEGKYFAHILEFDIVTEAPTKEALNEALKQLVEAHLLYASNHNAVANLFRPAPLEYWQKYSKGLSLSRIRPNIEEVLL